MSNKIEECREKASTPRDDEVLVSVANLLDQAANVLVIVFDKPREPKMKLVQIKVENEIKTVWQPEAESHKKMVPEFILALRNAATWTRQIAERLKPPQAMIAWNKGTAEANKNVNCDPHACASGHTIRK